MEVSRKLQEIAKNKMKWLMNDLVKWFPQKKKYTNSLGNTTFGSGKKSCWAKFVLTKLLNTTWRELRVSEGISVSLYVLSEEWELFENAF